MQITIENETDLQIPVEQIESIASALSAREIELLVIDNDAMQAINSEHRGKDAPTDVLSFPLEGEFAGMPLGSIVISADKVREKAAEFGHSDEDEFALLFIHGLLHLLGYDHEIDEGEMRAEEKRLIELYDLPKSLIVRTEE